MGTVVSESELDQDLNAANSVAQLLGSDSDGEEKEVIHLEITTKLAELGEEKERIGGTDYL